LFTVAHPKELAWIVRSKKKNDRVDSLKIAKLHMVGMLPEPNRNHPAARLASFRVELQLPPNIGSSISGV